jgi:hypothetical protein
MENEQHVFLYCFRVISKCQVVSVRSYELVIGPSESKYRLIEFPQCKLSCLSINNTLLLNVLVCGWLPFIVRCHPNVKFGLPRDTSDLLLQN